MKNLRVYEYFEKKQRPYEPSSRNDAHAPHHAASKRTTHQRQDHSAGPMPRKKKGLGQHFLRKQSTVDNMIAAVTITPETSIMEIGCGDGFLTKSILDQSPCKQVWCFEIDKEWADYVGERIKTPRLTIHLQNILELDFDATLTPHAPWVMLANLPYNITFPIIFSLIKNKHLFAEGVVMVQEEVAQKIVADHGKRYNPTSLYLQHHFDWKLLEKIEPQAFTPAPKVYSRLLYFKPKANVSAIPDEENFWKFLKLCFKTPRQTIKNNLKSTHLRGNPLISEDVLALRAQQMTVEQFLSLWNTIRLADENA